MIQEKELLRLNNQNRLSPTSRFVPNSQGTSTSNFFHKSQPLSHSMKSIGKETPVVPVGCRNKRKRRKKKEQSKSKQTTNQEMSGNQKKCASHVDVDAMSTTTTLTADDCLTLEQDETSFVGQNQKVDEDSETIDCEQWQKHFAKTMDDEDCTRPISTFNAMECGNSLSQEIFDCELRANGYSSLPNFCYNNDGECTPTANSMEQSLNHVLAGMVHDCLGQPYRPTNATLNIDLNQQDSRLQQALNQIRDGIWLAVQTVHGNSQSQPPFDDEQSHSEVSVLKNC